MWSSVSDLDDREVFYVAVQHFFYCSPSFGYKCLVAFCTLWHVELANERVIRCLLEGSRVLSLKPSWWWIITPLFCFARCSNYTFQWDIRCCFDLPSGVGWTLNMRVCTPAKGCGQCALVLLGSLLCGSALSTNRKLSLPLTVVFICKYTGGQIAPCVPMAFCLTSPWTSISWQAPCSGGTPAERPAGRLSALAHHRGGRRETGDAKVCLSLSLNGC